MVKLLNKVNTNYSMSAPLR